MADELVAEEVEGHAVLVPPGYPDSNDLRVESRGLVQITARDREMKDLVGIDYWDSFDLELNLGKL